MKLAQTQPPRQSKSLLITSLLVIGACLFVVSLALSAFAVTWDPCSVLGGFILLPVPIFLAVQQYLGTFRQSRKAAERAASLLIFVGGFALTIFVLGFGLTFFDSEGQPWANFLLPVLTVSIIAIFAWRLNLSWARNLKTTPELPPRLWFTSRELLGAVAAIGVTLGITSHFIRTEPPQYAEHVERDDVPFSLPEGATDISYFRRPRGAKVYEFTMSETAYFNWIYQKVKLRKTEDSVETFSPITAPIDVRRYCEFSDELSGPSPFTVNSGHAYSWYFEDQGVIAVYDSTTNRVYYEEYWH